MPTPTYVGFTGSREMTEATEWAIRNVITHLPRSAIVVTGGCIGVDAYVARLATGYGLHVHTIPPADRSRVDPDWEQHCLTCFPMPEGTTYKDRNQAIVDRADRLYGFPRYSEAHPKSKRSGTWQTIRMAIKKDIPTEIFIPSEFE